MQTVSVVHRWTQHWGVKRSLDPCAVDGPEPVARDVAAADAAADTAADVVAAVGTVASAVAVVGR